MHEYIFEEIQPVTYTQWGTDQPGDKGMCAYLKDDLSLRWYSDSCTNTHAVLCFIENYNKGIFIFETVTLPGYEGYTAVSSMHRCILKVYFETLRLHPTKLLQVCQDRNCNIWSKISFIRYRMLHINGNIWGYFTCD